MAVQKPPWSKIEAAQLLGGTLSDAMTSLESRLTPSGEDENGTQLAGKEVSQCQHSNAKK